MADNPIQKFITRLDGLQQRHKALAFPYAVIKKYGDDEGGYQGALITYYGFLSLFPLLIVFTSIVDIIAQRNDVLRARLLTDLDSYFPIVGNQLQQSVHGSGRSGLALIIGLIFSLYGARGVADALRHALNHVWEVPKTARAGFPKGLLKSMALIVGGGLGFLLAAVLSGFATAALGHIWLFRLLPLALSFLMLLTVFVFIFRIGSSSGHSYHELYPGAATAALGLLILQTLGGYLVTHELRNLNGTYGQFGLVLAIFFWLYLQAQVLLYAAEVNTVKSLHLWPRSLTQSPLTSADKQAFALYAKRETYKQPPEDVRVDFEGDQ